MTKEHIGFAGLGLMGHGMAKNIVAKGYPLTATISALRLSADLRVTMMTRLVSK